MSADKAKLIEAEEIALQLFKIVEDRNLIASGKSERQLNTEIYDVARELFGIEKHWHKRIVRSGGNTLSPYKENPPNLMIEDDDILFFDFGPIIEGWEADLGRTYVIGNDPYKHKLKNDIERAWQETKEWFHKHTSLTAAGLFQYSIKKAEEYGWVFGGEIAGHLIGEFPHEKLEPGNFDLYVHPENHNDMFLPDAKGNKRQWILEMHFVDTKQQIGGFFEQLLT
ncbi:M24 family metallopeptidase [Aquimarina sp. 2304DJ70-9]|uniref:M24 family metallopeptidase n=1 Tax=Aquimarina penaris TaxID=3231044 RepID=UPI003461DBB6